MNEFLIHVLWNAAPVALGVLVGGLPLMAIFAATFDQSLFRATDEAALNIERAIERAGKEVDTSIGGIGILMECYFDKTEIPLTPIGTPPATETRRE